MSKVFLVVVAQFILFNLEIKSQSLDSIFKSKIKIIQKDSNNFSVMLDQVKIGYAHFNKGVSFPMVHFDFNNIYLDDSFRISKSTNESYYDYFKDFLITNKYYKNGKLKEKEILFLSKKDTSEFNSPDSLWKKIENGDTIYSRKGARITKFIKPVSEGSISRMNLETGQPEIVGVLSEGSNTRESLLFFYNRNGAIDSMKYSSSKYESRKWKVINEIMQLTKDVDLEVFPEEVLYRIDRFYYKIRD